MNHFDPGNPVWQWWLALSLVSAGNIVAWVLVRRAVVRKQSGIVEDDQLAARMVALAGIYVFVCAFRSVVPRADVQRITLFDSWVATVFVGRTAATLAELSFVAQWALALDRASRLAGAKLARSIALCAVPAIALAECFSWYAVISTNYLGNVIEESIWALLGLCAVVASASLWPRYRGTFQRVLAICCLSAIGYSAFMVLHDVPMYIGRWRAAQAAGSVALPLWEGLRDVANRRVITWQISDWREEIPWMSFYFSLSVWFSIGLCLVNLRSAFVQTFVRPDRSE